MSVEVEEIRKRNKRRVAEKTDLHGALRSRIVGQPGAVDRIIPYIHTYQAGLCPEGRPVGVFLMLGPTGTGKTRTVEALAEVLHGNAKNVLRIDCGEYQMDHEVSKLIGAPPGYLGHRETHPLLTQARLASVTTEKCGLSIVLFDEIEKAAPSMSRLLLGILDKGVLRLGDNTVVNFERSAVFFTSNLGASRMMKELAPSFGFQGAEVEQSVLASRMSQVAQNAAKKNFAPEFMNRVDAVITYQPLSQQSLLEILDQQIRDLQHHIDRRLGTRAFRLFVSDQSRRLLLKKGTSVEYGAREIKRTLHSCITQPLALLVAEGRVRPGSAVQAVPHGDDVRLRLMAPGR